MDKNRTLANDLVSVPSAASSILPVRPQTSCQGKNCPHAIIRQEGNKKERLFKQQAFDQGTARVVLTMSSDVAFLNCTTASSREPIILENAINAEFREIPPHGHEGLDPIVLDFVTKWHSGQRLRHPSAGQDKSPRYLVEQATKCFNS